MIVRRSGLVLGGATLGLLAAALTPDLAAAHGLVGKQDLPIPRWLFAWAAAIVLVVSFVGLASLWPRARLQETTERRATGLPRALGVVCGALGVAFFALAVYAGLAGEQSNPQANLIVTAVFVLFWVGIPFLSVVFGDVFRAFNPWLAIARAAAWLWRRLPGEMPAALPYPPRLGRWPAVAGILAFAWVELVYVGKDDPSTLAVMALLYCAVQFVGMSLYGIDEWERHGDAFGVYYGLFGRLSPLEWRRGALWVRRPLEGVVGLDTVPGTVALVVTMIGTTSFDGFSQGPTWFSVSPHLQHAFESLGLSAEGASEGAYTIGMLFMVAVIATLYRIGIAGMRTVRRGDDAGALSRSFAHTLVPIALAYVVAHYFSLLVYQSQAVGYLASDPLGHGSDLFGTASIAIDYGVVSATAIWYVQVVALLAGHVAGLVLAHDRALALYRDPKQATQSQLWMLGVMVCFTSLGLWLLSNTGQ